MDVRQVAGALPDQVVDLGLRAARAYWRTVNPFRVGVQCIVEDEGGRILLVRHSYGRRLWHLPGGGLHRRETLLAGLRREVAEETGLTLTRDPDALELLGVYSNFAEGKSDHTAVFVAAPGTWRGEPRPGGIEVVDVTFVDVDRLPPATSRGTRARLEERAGRRSIDYEW